MSTPELVAALTAYVTPGVYSSGGADGAFITACADEATALVSREIGSAVVPADIVLRAQVECGSELFQRRSAPQGVTQFAAPGGDGTAVRVSRDPMSGARLILRPWLPGGFA